MHQLSDDGTNYDLSNQLLSAAQHRISISMPYTISSVKKNNDAGNNSDFLSRHNSNESSNLKNLDENDNPSHFQDQEFMELYLRVQAQKNEIISLRERIAGASVKDLQLLNEKYTLERKVADMRMTLDEKQNEIVSIAGEEIARRKGDLENNLNLIHELKETEAERYIFVSSIVALLAEYGISPRVINASTLSYNVKHLHDQLQLKIKTMQAKIGNLYSTVEKRKAVGNSAIRDIPGSSLLTNPYAPPSQSEFSFHNNPINERHMEPVFSMSRNAHNNNDSGQMTNSIPKDRMVSNSDREVAQISHNNFVDRRGNMTYEEKPDLSNPLHRNDTDVDYDYDSEEDGPGIEGFQIIGDAIPGSKLLGCGYPVRGTSLCMFQWVRHNQDGTRQFIEGATNPEYTITADDVDKLVAVECIPMNDQGHQGEIVRLFANDQNKITCDPEMQQEIDTYISEGEAVYNVQLLMEPSKDWEQTTLILQRTGFQIQINKTQDIMSDSFSVDFSINIPAGMTSQFNIGCSDGSSYSFNASSMRMRDIIVLTMRMFQNKALDEKRKGRS
ncbi:uncharacterized protein LOC108202820 isoform X1 [Daucus carota subsp. sativus]|uniref:uncharacterized protein LOC108202820 isoform X1 n=1 Tax=Daucus carota subsp. sativus TaxID=79200 RepID=UPI0007F04771|nr:PREDICTED: uncharacterized protein LOC108202820 isoform X1 [Daucus carota subsp. sativus]XP_017226854.1 PREDICTED: uncharacterized protein LOC108202820 isoform X1 [Daucus carota subsp. sativus]XP_017226855.1 PREDICTED: uncharacterized protein LOC108202820 isoform X1 [Daucus carota subsp. sativus]XP_017226856.1 PREDICTED: uncharacterized protein LOC108202820 isoform X1 [Daucus carota subsp. sativus]